MHWWSFSTKNFIVQTPALLDIYKLKNEYRGAFHVTSDGQTLSTNIKIN